MRVLWFFSIPSQLYALLTVSLQKGNPSQLLIYSMEVNINIGCWTLIIKCTQYGLYAQAAFKNARSSRGWDRPGLGQARVGVGQDWDGPGLGVRGSSIFSVAPAARCPDACNTPMIGENQKLIIDEPVEVRDFKKITDHFIENYRIYPNLKKENWRMSTCNRLHLQTIGSQPTVPKNLPNHCNAHRGVFTEPRMSLSLIVYLSNLFCAWKKSHLRQQVHLIV
jgi:hypothetical protein